MWFSTAPEVEALERWQKGDFMDVERVYAKRWRRGLEMADLDANCAPYRALIDAQRPRSLPERRVLRIPRRAGS